MKKLLITLGLVAGLNSIYGGPLHRAAHDGDIDELKRLIEIGVSLEHRDDSWLGSTAIFFATDADADNSVDFLISEGANVNQLNDLKQTPIFFALSYKNSSPSSVKIFNSLIKGGSNINHQDAKGCTALMWYINVQNINLHGNLQDVKLFLDNGANVNLEDNEGNTAIHYVSNPSFSSKERIEILKLLIKNGADVNKRNKYGEAPLDNVVDKDHFFGQILQDAGAKTGLKLLEEKISTTSTGNTNPTDEWPRKMWEIDFSGTTLPQISSYEIGSDKAVIIFGDNNCIWISSLGEYMKIDEGYHASSLAYISNQGVVLRKEKNINLYQKVSAGMRKKTFNNSSLISNYYDDMSQLPKVSFTIEDSKLIGWDLTPPTLATTDKEDGNNGGNTAMSRLSIGKSGPDISIAADGKLGGPAELQKSNDLKNWRKLGDVPADGGHLLITPRDNGNEFFRLKKKE